MVYHKIFEVAQSPLVDIRNSAGVGRLLRTLFAYYFQQDDTASGASAGDGEQGSECSAASASTSDDSVSDKDPVGPNVRMSIRKMILESCSTLLLRHKPLKISPREMEHLLCHTRTVASHTTACAQLDYVDWLISIVCSQAFDGAFTTPESCQSIVWSFVQLLDSPSHEIRVRGIRLVGYVLMTTPIDSVYQLAIYCAAGHVLAKRVPFLTRECHMMLSHLAQTTVPVAGPKAWTTRSGKLTQAAALGMEFVLLGVDVPAAALGDSLEPMLLKQPIDKQTIPATCLFLSDLRRLLLDPHNLHAFSENHAVLLAPLVLLYGRAKLGERIDSVAASGVAPEVAAGSKWKAVSSQAHHIVLAVVQHRLINLKNGWLSWYWLIAAIDKIFPKEATHIEKHNCNATTRTEVCCAPAC